MFFLLPLLAIGICVYAAQRRGSDAANAPIHAIASGAVPSPIAVMSGFLRDGQTPPPTVIMCAIAEAEATGNLGLADDIVRAFILPVVNAHEIAVARDVNPYAIGAAKQAKRHRVPLYSKEDLAAKEAAKADKTSDSASPAGDKSADANASSDGKIKINSEDDIKRALESMQSAYHGDVRAAHAAPRGGSAQVSRGAARGARIGEIIGEAAGRAWDEFVGRVAREAPSFRGPRHVGQFRQRRDRLSELGIDPDSIVDMPDAQEDALARDMEDAYAHARDGGLAEHVGRTIAIPDHYDTEVTLSGVMGVIQAAGLEGACEWFDRPADRKRFPHTTAAFVRTNGVF